MANIRLNITETNYGCLDVEAESAEAVHGKALEEYNNGNVVWTDSKVTEIKTDEGVIIGDNIPIIGVTAAAKSENTKFTGGGVPYGYIIDSGGALGVDSDKAAVISEIFKSRAEGATLQHIADSLNKMGIKSGRGGEWTKQAIAFILKNRAYIGEYHYKGRNEDDKTAGKIPKIVSKQLFDKANKQK